VRRTSGPENFQSSAKKAFSTLSANNGRRGLAHESLGCHRKVVLHWGELGTGWGISPTVAQIHAQLYSRSALSAKEIVDALSVARCKVSTGLKEL
jgi:hypothetical protein